jgi:hypothetical protein
MAPFLSPRGVLCDVRVGEVRSLLDVWCRAGKRACTSMWQDSPPAMPFLASVTAFDAICCLRLGKLRRGQATTEQRRQRTVHPSGPKLATQFVAVLAMTDPSTVMA